MDNQENQNQNPILPVPPVVQTPSVSKPKSKLPIIIGVVLFFLIVGSAAGFYVFKQQSLKTAVKPTPSPVVQRQIPTPIPDPTANWKTYQGNGVSFNYPSNGKVDTNQPSTVSILSNTKPYFGFFVWIEENPNHSDTKEVVNTNIEKLRIDKNIPWAKTEADQTLQTMKEYSNGQITGIKLQSFDEGYPQKFGTVIEAKNNKIYTFQIYDGFGRGVSDDDEKLLDQILSTFKFTDQENSSEANWINVNGESFTVKMPPQWQIVENSSNKTYISGGGFYIIFGKNKGQITEQVKNETKNKIASQLNVKNRIIGGKQAIEYFGCLNPEACEVVHYILIPTNSNEFINIEFINNDPTIGNLSSEPIFDQILSTFTFAPLSTRKFTL